MGQDCGDMMLAVLQQRHTRQENEDVGIQLDVILWRKSQSHERQTAKTVPTLQTLLHGGWHQVSEAPEEPRTRTRTYTHTYTGVNIHLTLTTCTVNMSHVVNCPFLLVSNQFFPYN